MKHLWQVFLILCACAVITFGTNFAPFTYERLTPSDDLKVVKDKTNRNFDKAARKDREGQEYDDDHFMWSGTGNTGVLAVVSVYLPFKYTSTNYAVIVSAKGNAASTFGVYYAIFADSAFNIYTTEPSKDFGWITMGARKTTE